MAQLPLNENIVSKSPYPPLIECLLLEAPRDAIVGLYVAPSADTVDIWQMEGWEAQRVRRQTAGMKLFM